MGDVAIRVEGLSKRYRIGQRQKYKTLRDTITDALQAPFRAAFKILKGPRSSVDGSPSSSHIWALTDVSFEVESGEVLGIIGRNGAGKSTLLRILSRVTEPTRGYVQVKGRVASLLEIGTGFHPELTGRENIFLNGAILGMRKREIERKFDEIVAFSGVEKFIDTPVKHYSSGMYLRLAFSVAAHLDTEILMVDEVLAVGDAWFQKKCLGKMGDAVREGRTVLFVSHNMAAVRSLCTRGLLIEKGTVAALGPVPEVQSIYIPYGYDLKPESPPANGEAGILECRVLAVRGSTDAMPVASSGFFADQPVRIWFRIRGSKEGNTRVALGGKLTDVEGNQIGSLYSDYFGVYYECKPGQLLEVEVINEGLRLAPGEYIFWPEMWSDLPFGFRRCRLSSPVQCVSFRVFPSDLFGSGYGDFSGGGPVLWNAIWSQP